MAKSVLSWLGQVASWSVILGVVVVLAVAVLIPRLAGATPYTVLTGSMRPHYPPGTLVVIKPVPIEQLGVGDIATYQITSGEPEVATHRIVGVGATLDGKQTFTFQGDANNAPDPKPVLPVQIRGKLWYAVPYLGYLNNALNGSQRQLAVWIVAALLIGYAAFMFVGAVRDRRRKRLPPVETEVPVPVRSPTGQGGVRGGVRGHDEVPLLLIGGGVAAFMALTTFIRLARRRSTT